MSPFMSVMKFDSVGGGSRRNGLGVWCGLLLVTED